MLGIIIQQHSNIKASIKIFFILKNNIRLAPRFSVVKNMSNLLISLLLAGFIIKYIR
jgi:hypothetical protein